MTTSLIAAVHMHSIFFDGGVSMSALIEVATGALEKIVNMAAEHPAETVAVVGTGLGFLAGYGQGYRDGTNEERGYKKMVYPMSGKLGFGKI